MPENFSTTQVDGAQRLRYWNDVAVQTFGEISVAPLGPAFSARMARVRVGPMLLADVTSTAARILGCESERTRRPGWFLLLNETGTSRLWQAGRETSLDEGDFTILGTDSPYGIEFRGPNRTRVLHLPAGFLALPLGRLVARRVASGSADPVTTLVRALAQAGNEASGAPGGDLDLLRVELARLAANARRRKPASMLTWQSTVATQLATHCVDPTLTPATLASRLGISLRFLHRVFAGTGRTAEASILEQRLLRAARQLRDRPAARITEIAFDCGFGDLSRFCHAFRQRFGRSASAWRKAAAPDDCTLEQTAPRRPS